MIERIEPDKTQYDCEYGIFPKQFGPFTWWARCGTLHASGVEKTRNDAEAAAGIAAEKLGEMWFASEWTTVDLLASCGKVVSRRVRP